MEIMTFIEKFGLPSGFVGIMIFLFLKSEERCDSAREDHRCERAEWRKGQEKLQGDTNKAINELIKAIHKSKAEKKPKERDGY